MASCNAQTATNLSSSSPSFPAIYLGFTILGEIFVYMAVFVFVFFCFLSSHGGSHILSSWMVHAACWVCFCASIQPSRTWMSGSLKSVRWNACVIRLDLGVYSHPTEFWGNGVKTHVNSKRKIPSTGESEEVWTGSAAPRRTVSPTHYQLSYSSPHYKPLIYVNAKSQKRSNKSSLCFCCLFEYSVWSNTRENFQH